MVLIAGFVGLSRARLGPCLADESLTTLFRLELPLLPLVSVLLFLADSPLHSPGSIATPRREGQSE